MTKRSGGKPRIMAKTSALAGTAGHCGGPDLEVAGATAE